MSSVVGYECAIKSLCCGRIIGVGYPTSIEERDVAERSLTHHVRVGREYPVEPKLCQNQDESSPFFSFHFGRTWIVVTTSGSFFLILGSQRVTVVYGMTEKVR